MTNRAFLLGVYLIVGTGLTATWSVLEDRLKFETGLLRSFHVGSGLETPPTRQEVTPNIDLTFVDEAPDLPRRFFSVRWQGTWYVSREQEIDIYCGADDLAVVSIDDEVVLEHNQAAGFHTVFERV